MLNKSFKKLARHGSLTAYQIKNDLHPIRALLRQGFVKKNYRRGRVYYELTTKSLPLLELLRLQLREEAKLRGHLYPRRADFYNTLLDDLRFFDTTKPEADDFLFLGDWRLSRTPSRAQLKLAQERFCDDDEK